MKFNYLLKGIIYSFLIFAICVKSESLELQDVKLNQEAINDIGSKNLDILKLYNVTFEKNLNYESLKGIKELNVFDYCEFENNFFSSLKSLKKIFIEDNQNIKQFHIDEISTLPNVEEVVFNFSSGDANIDLNVLKNLKNLTTLDLSYYGGKVNLNGFKSLKTLNLRNLKLNQSIINDIGEFPNLETLYITYDIESKNLDLGPLKKMKSLSNLFINGLNEKYDHHKELGTNALKGFDNIKKLYLERFILKQSDIDDIASLAKLEEIEFDFCYLEKATIDALNKLNIKGLDELYNREEDENISISTNGKCGIEDGKCPSGECCSKYGWCGTSDAYCNTGCQSEFGECKNTSTTKTTTTKKTTTSTKQSSLPTSTNSKCGPKDGKCPDGQCCSKYGWCGTSESYCVKDCQPEFGVCKNSSTVTNTTKKTTTKKTTTTNKSLPTSTNGKCGSKDGRCPDGKCCSKYGWCGSSDIYCGNGCQSEFGICN